MHLSIELGLRLVWFPDISHVEHNVDKNVIAAYALEQLSEKALLLGRLHRGPKKAAGKWHGQIKKAHKARPAAISGLILDFMISGLNFRLRFQAWTPGLDFRFRFQAWISGLDFRLRFQVWTLRLPPVGFRAEISG